MFLTTLIVRIPVGVLLLKKRGLKDKQIITYSKLESAQISTIFFAIEKKRGKEGYDVARICELHIIG